MPEAHSSQYKILRQLGFIQTVDIVFLTVLVCRVVLQISWNTMVSLGVLNASKFDTKVTAFLSILILLVWLIVMSYRILYFILKLTADVKLMPGSAAAEAVKILRS